MGAHVPGRDERGRQRADHEDAAITHVRQRASSQPARIATAIHMIWKYLFMSNSTALTTTTFGTMNSATIQATRNQRQGRPRARNAATTARSDRDPEVGQVEEHDRGRPVIEARLAPAEHEPERPDLALEYDGAGDERRGQDDRRQEQERVAQDRPHPPGAGRQDVQRHDEVGRREGEELERREERGQDARRAAPRAAGDRGTPRRSSTTVTSPGSPSVVARCGRNPVPKIDAILKNGQPSAQVLSYESRLTRSSGPPSPASTSPTSRIQPSPPPNRRGSPRSWRGAVRRSAAWRDAQTTSARTAANSALVAK